ncbi:hypothetical protein [uncultured Sphingomonas sp.]|uniref:hypothetical protein n=1 Tax=uncultured Sphingomonas sp. TaxID=158754 RepID=UPI0035CC4C06
MNTTTARPVIGDFLQVPFAPAGAAALSRTNSMAKEVRDLPERLISDELRSDRDRVLGTHLSDLLAAHRDARAAGAADADAELADGLQHIDEELRRILAACRSRATDSLEVQSRFLEQRYPGDKTFGLLGDGSEDVAPQSIEGTNPRTLGRDSLEGLFSPATAPARARPTFSDRSGQAFNRLEFLTIATLALIALLLIVLMLNHDPRAADKAMRAKVDVAATIDDIRRVRTNSDGVEQVYAEVDLRGSVRNRADRPLDALGLEIDLFSCPQAGLPLTRCTLVTKTPVYPDGIDDLRPGLTGRFRHTSMALIPDVDGHLRASIRVVSTRAGQVDGASNG